MMATKKKTQKNVKSERKGASAVNLSTNQQKKPRGKPFVKGTSGNPGGRPKGSVSYKTKLIEQKLAELDFDPIAAMVELYREKDCPQPVKAKLASELANYIFPKRKSVEHSGGLNSKTSKELSDGELMAIANGGEQ